VIALPWLGSTRRPVPVGSPRPAGWLDWIYVRTYADYVSEPGRQGPAPTRSPFASTQRRSRQPPHGLLNEFNLVSFHLGGATQIGEDLQDQFLDMIYSGWIFFLEKTCLNILKRNDNTHLSCLRLKIYSFKFNTVYISRTKNDKLGRK
jgi:hypothetical protein